MSHSLGKCLHADLIAARKMNEIHTLGKLNDMDLGDVFGISLLPSGIFHWLPRVMSLVAWAHVFAISLLPSRIFHWLPRAMFLPFHCCLARYFIGCLRRHLFSLIYLEFDGINLKIMTFIWLNLHVRGLIRSYYGLKCKQI